MTRIPAQSPCGVKLGYVSLGCAYRLIRERRAKGVGTKRRIDYVVILSAIVRESIPGGALKSHYDEDLGNGMHLAMLKRVVGGKLRKWDPALTFDDLRSGRAIPNR
jgi:hypothetical protein